MEHRSQPSFWDRGKLLETVEPTNGASEYMIFDIGSRCEFLTLNPGTVKSL